MLLKVLTVIGLASFQLSAAIPAGFAFHLSPWAIFLSSVAGGMIGLCFVALFGGRIRRLLLKPKSTQNNRQKRGIIYKFWNKYGNFGLGFFGTLAVGAPMSMSMGISLNGSVKRLILWCSMGIIGRCLLFTAIAHFGFNIF